MNINEKDNIIYIRDMETEINKTTKVDNSECDIYRNKLIQRITGAIKI